MANNGKRRSVKWLVTLIVIGSVVAGGVAYYYHQTRNGEPEYQTAPVTRGEITQAVTATGTLNPVLNVQVGSQISGIIEKLYVDFNSLVKSNQVIAQLDPATYQANVNSAEGDLANAKASLELAQVNARRAEELFKNKLIAQSEYDQSVATLHQSEAQVKIKQASLERARVDLARCTIYAPVDGIVIDRKVDVGQTVAASLSAPVLFQIANDLTKMQIDANVAEADVGGVEVGQRVDFTVDAFPMRTFHGKVTQIRNSPITVQNVVTYDTVIEVANRDMKLKPGMTANVSIIVARHEDVLKVPNAALRFRPPEGTAAAGTNAAASVVAQQTPRPSEGASGTRGGGDGERRRGPGGAAGERGNRARVEGRAPRMLYILATGETQLKPVQVKLGITDTIATEIVEGLNEGDQVVVGMISKNSEAPAANPFGRPRGFPRRF